MRKRNCISSVVLLSGCAMTGVTLAQDVPEPVATPDAELYPTVPVDPMGDAPPPEEAKVSSSSRLVEEIIVTAQKREEQIQDVPVSVAAFSSDQLSALGVESTQDLGRVTPGLQFSGFAGFTLIYLRGVGTDSFLPYSDPSVATYIDGLYIPAQQGLVNSFGGVERVEVLKGPQGTLFGRNSTGGAINVITKNPDQTTEATAQVEFGNFGARKAQVYASFPITETFAASVSGIYNEEDPYYRQVSDDLGPNELPPADKLKGDRSEGMRVKLRWTPTDTLDLGLSGYRLIQEGASSTISALKKPSALASTFGIEAEQRAYEFHRNEPTALKINNSTVAANATWTLPGFDLKLIGGHQMIVTDDAFYDFDQSAQDLVSFFTRYAYNRVTTGEFQITSNDESWLSDRFEWIAGVYYLTSSGGYDPIILELANSGLPLITGVPVLGPIATGLLPSGLGLQAAIHGVLETNAYSAFAQGTWNFTDWFALTLGGRYQIEDRFLTEQNVMLVNSSDGSESPLLNYNEPEVDQENFSPKVSLNFIPADDVLVYLSYSKGFKSGTYNGINIYTAPTYVEPEEADAYELGLKSEWFGGALRFNAAVFQTKIDKPQVTFVSLTNGGAITFENAGAARIRGAEIDTLALPFADSNPGFVVTLGVSYLDSIFTDYQGGSGFDEETGLFFGEGAVTGPQGRDFSGNRIPRSPEWSGNVGLNQTLDTAWGPLEVGIDSYYNSGFFYSAQNSNALQQKEYSLLNARVSYLYEAWDLRLTVFGQNLDNETYSYAQFTADFGTADTLAPPRTYGVRLNWTF